MAQQGRVLRHAGDIKHSVEFARGEDRLADEPAVGPRDDAQLGEAFADERNDDFKCFEGAIAGITIARAQLRPHRPRTDEAIERQIAVDVVVAVEEPDFLIAVAEAVGGIEVEHDLIRLRLTPTELSCGQPISASLRFLGVGFET